MATKQCAKCGRRISDKNTVCPHCGEHQKDAVVENFTKKLDKKIETKSQKENQSLMKCAACRENISKKALACPLCGEPVRIKAKISFWSWILILFIFGWIGSFYSKPSEKSSTVSSSAKYNTPSEPGKKERTTLKGGYFACISEALFHEINSAAVNKDNLAIEHLLSKGCVLAKAGSRISIIDFGFATTKIRAYVDNDSVVLYTNTENVYY